MKPLAHPFSNGRRAQRGAVNVLGVGVLLMTVASFVAFGVGQLMWEKRRVQNAADESARVAATEIDNSNFTSGYQAALNNGARSGETTIACTGTTGAGDCYKVRSTVTRSTAPYFFTSNYQTPSIAEVQMYPYVAGAIGNRVASVDSSQSTVLNALLGGALGGGALSISVGDYSALLSSSAQIDLIKLNSYVSLIGSGNQPNASNVSVAGILTAAATVGGSSLDAATSGAVSRVASAVSGLNVAPANFLIVNLGNGTTLPTSANVDLGALAVSALLGSLKNVQINTSINLGTLVSVKVKILEPPKTFILSRNRTSSSTNMSPTGGIKTEQVSITVTTLDGLAWLTTNVANGQVDINTMSCILPRTSSYVNMTLKSDTVSSTFFTPAFGLPLSIPSSATSTQDVYAPAPVTKTTQLSATTTLASLGVGNLNLLGGVTDTLLSALGIKVNQVVVTLDTINCTKTQLLQ